MSRSANTQNRTLKLESLESRELLAGGGPSAEAQYMLELINQARTNPAAIADRVTSNLDPDVQATVRYYGVDLQGTRNAIASQPARPPVAWSDPLAVAAISHSQDMVNSGFQSHTGSDGSRPGDRLDRVGYTHRKIEAENAYAYADSVDNAMQAFLVDWGVEGAGHRGNIMQPNVSPEYFYDEVGIGIINSNRPGMGPKVVTQNFAARTNNTPYLLGVAFNDHDNDRQYDPNEGEGNLTIEAVNLATGEVRTAEAWDSGGYQVPLTPGTYQVTARVNGRVFRTDRVTIGNQNVKVDYNLDDRWQDAAPAPVARQTTPPPVVAPTPPVVNNARVFSASPTNSPSRASALRSATNWLTSWSAWTARRAW